MPRLISLTGSSQVGSWRFSSPREPLTKARTSWAGSSSIGESPYFSCSHRGGNSSKGSSVVLGERSGSDYVEGVGACSGDCKKIGWVGEGWCFLPRRQSLMGSTSTMVWTGSLHPYVLLTCWSGSKSTCWRPSWWGKKLEDSSPWSVSTFSEIKTMKQVKDSKLPSSRGVHCHRNAWVRVNSERSTLCPRIYASFQN